jgi:hypothetical protein
MGEIMRRKMAPKVAVPGVTIEAVMEVVASIKSTTVKSTTVKSMAEGWANAAASAAAVRHGGHRRQSDAEPAQGDGGEELLQTKWRHGPSALNLWRALSAFGRANSTASAGKQSGWLVEIVKREHSRALPDRDESGSALDSLIGRIFFGKPGSALGSSPRAGFFR